MVPLDSDGGGIAFALPANGADNAAIGEAVDRLLADGTIDNLTRRHLPGYLPSP
ncbi:MAG: hypothetical protein GDA49_00490 [Rhodospirillales bacterium]|nr:hypothetical protein [Rhodospirillales bacterium]